MSIFTSVALGWLGRRVLDWGGWLGSFLLAIIGLYNGLPPVAQEAVQAVLSGHWQDITLGSLIPLTALVWSQVASFRATVRPQVVTPRGEKVELAKLAPAEQQAVTATVEASARPRTILEALADKLNKSWRR
jgi:hypothetical protein